MDQATLIDVYGWLTVAAFIAVAGSLIWVWTFWRWYQSPLGQSYMAVKILLAANLFLPALHQVLGIQYGSSTAFIWVFIALMLLLIPAVVWRAAVLFVIQRHDASNGGGDELFFGKGPGAGRKPPVGPDQTS